MSRARAPLAVPTLDDRVGRQLLEETALLIGLEVKVQRLHVSTRPVLVLLLDVAAMDVDAARVSSSRPTARVS